MTFVSTFLRALRLDAFFARARRYPLAYCLLAAILAATILLHRYLHILIGLWSFLVGMVTFYWALEPDSLLPNILFACTAPPKRQEPELFPSAGSCAVCGKVKCTRHRPTLLLENYQPWLGLELHSKVDASIAEVFELVLENFVYPWYREITDDEACVDELRWSFRFLASVLVRRAQKVDLPAVLADRAMRAAVKHVEVLSRARARVRQGRTLQQAALEEYGGDLHVAVRSRKQELLYLRKLSEMLFPYLMPPKATDCRSLALLLREVVSGSVLLPTMDFVADPDTVNLMVLKFLDDTPPEPAAEAPSARVPFLHRYADCSGNKRSVLKLELKEIREQQDLLFRFMNFLKQEGAVHVLQFCLAVEELNDKILSPELADSELRRLHGELAHIYRTYCLDESVDKINLDRAAVEDIRKVAAGPYGAVVKLRTMRCLFEAYEHVLSLLEGVFAPMFCHSDEYFRHLLKGAESPARSSRAGRNAAKRAESFAISRIGSKIKGVFRSTTVDGAVLPPGAGTDVDVDGGVEEATVVTEDDAPAPAPAGAGSLRRLSSWSVAIPYVDLYEDDAKREKIPVFCIDVERNDRKEIGHDPERWSVHRRYLEFYVLESKLTEFHGAFADTQLPPRRILGPKNHEFLTSKREDFEDYLQKLLRYPELSNSQLLVDFLSPHGMGSQFEDRMLPDVNLGKIFKSVPGKLMKEKGQNLEPFIQSFFNSCESPRAKASRPELTVLSPSADANKRLLSQIYRDDGNVAAKAGRPERRGDRSVEVGLDGAYDYLLHTGRLLFRMPRWLDGLLSATRILLKNTFEAYVERRLRAKMDAVLQEHRLVSLITQLRDAVFYESAEERGGPAKAARAERTLEEMMAYLPDVVGTCVGEEAKREGVGLLFEALQQPLLNKQMSYVLLDVAVLELFPELRQ
ncbi:sorting nexin-14-like [Hippocampus zosterae]|uniref:sorting nexin-14-like n=1 Tax=Hippocampus zosterae TaxID=109293 RepID=UPI00223C9797|nr:sorting nexin-14-like [Hippocampus zosterae]XP_051909319.1 sorting nexin-14-like [Hippocampus zosterae]XP_051909321.1 sorting nexin-14-like [Hippocampus zosterae]XP_051909322.1 sorting nexin-14-like [Hippocampus zosterae]